MNVVELEFDSLRTGEITLTKVSNIIVFKDLDCDVYLGVWIGAREKEAILSLLSGKNILFSATSIRFKNCIILLQFLGVVASRVIITHLDKDIFRAKAILLTGKSEEDIQVSLEGRFADLMFLTLKFNPRYFVNVETIKSVGVISQEIDVMDIQEEIGSPAYQEKIRSDINQYYLDNNGSHFNIPQVCSMRDMIFILLKNKLIRL